MLGLLALVVILQMATSVVSSHMVGRASFRAGQVREDLLVVDELSESRPRLGEGSRRTLTCGLPGATD